MVHENIKNHKCSICNKAFGQSVALKRHFKVIHEKIKEYKCDVENCGKEFPTLRELRQHFNSGMD